MKERQSVVQERVGAEVQSESAESRWCAEEREVQVQRESGGRW
jgi:hypothetical protein